MKRSIYIIIVFLLCIGSFTFVTKAASPKLSSKEAKLKVQNSVTVELKNVSKKGTIVTDASLKKKKKTKKTIYWSVKNPITASIKVKKNKVTITGWKAGTTTVKAKYNGKIYSIGVTVKKASDSLSPKSVSLIMNEDIPAYWESELEDAAGKALARKNTNIASFFYITDTHWDANSKKSPAMINLLSETLDIPLTLCGGDVITGTHETSIEGQKELSSFYNSFKNVSIFSAIGNHDTNSNGKNVPKTAPIKQTTVYDIIFKRIESFGKTSKNLDYAYTDDAENKVRYISFYYDEAHPELYTKDIQRWVDNRVKELDKDWSVILISHAYWKYAKPKENCTIPSKSAQIAKHLLSLQKDSKATIAAWMVGHNHRDMSKTLTDESGTNRLTIISTNCDAFEKSAIQGGENMKKGTISEQAFDIVMVDTTKKRLHMIRVGAGKDRVFYY